MSNNVILTSIHGRRLGLSSSGGVLIAKTSSTGVSHLGEISSAGVFESSIDSWTAVGQFGSTLSGYKSFFETASASSVTLSNKGMTHVTSDLSVIGATLLISAPEIGVEKEIYLDSSASTLSLGSTSSDITFGTSIGTSVLVLDQVGGVRGTALRMRGISATRWALLGKHSHADFADG